MSWMTAVFHPLMAPHPMKDTLRYVTLRVTVAPPIYCEPSLKRWDTTITIHCLKLSWKWKTAPWMTMFLYKWWFPTSMIFSGSALQTIPTSHSFLIFLAQSMAPVQIPVWVMFQSQLPIGLNAKATRLGQLAIRKWQ